MMKEESFKEFRETYHPDLIFALVERIMPFFHQKILEMGLPGELVTDLENFYIPLSLKQLLITQKSDKPHVIGICGAQGSGKTTFAELLKISLESLGLKVVSFSIDDFYLTYDERRELSKNEHLLLRTRGVPGTHDVAMGIEIIEKLIQNQSKKNIQIPRFDKALDDRLPDDQWQSFSDFPDIILFEGWCVGAKQQPVEELECHVNRFEIEFDPDKRFRRYVNDKLATTYQKWFSLIDSIIMLKVPSFEKVFEWRCLQEHKLMQQTRTATSGIMDKKQVDFFISHFERLTRYMLDEMPSRANYVLEIDETHRIKSIQIREEKV